MEEEKMVYVFCDGASNPKTKISGVGCVWVAPGNVDTKVVECPKLTRFEFIKVLNETLPLSGDVNATNNEAEYMSLIRAMELSIDMGYKKLVVFMDSKLIVMQVLGLWKINFEHLRKLNSRVQELKKKIDLKVVHVLREYNQIADDASKGMFPRISKWKSTGGRDSPPRKKSLFRLSSDSKPNDQNDDQKKNNS